MEQYVGKEKNNKSSGNSNLVENYCILLGNLEIYILELIII